MRHRSHKQNKTIMANFNGTVDLMKLRGVKYLSGIDKANPARAYICIPAEWNDVKVVNDPHATSGYRGPLRLAMYQTNEKYAAACIKAKQERGDDMTDYNPPSHTCQLRYSSEYLKILNEAAKKAILDKHLEWNTPELKDETRNTDLKYAMSDMVRIPLGSFYVNHPMQQNSAPPMAEHAAPDFSQATAPVEGEGNPDDDLPF